MSIRHQLLSSFQSFYGNLGGAIERRPWSTILIATFVAIAVGMGAGGVKMETEGVYLWIPTTSETYNNFLAYNDDFNSGSKLNIFSYIVQSSDGGSVLRKSVLNQIVSIHVDTTYNITNGEGKNFENHCFRASASEHGIDSPCLFSNPLAAFGYAKAKIPSNEADILAMVNAADAVAPLDGVLGGLKRDSTSGEITFADSMLLG